MARHLSLQLTIEVSINETDLALLRYLGSASDARDMDEAIPVRALAEALGVCASTVRRSAKALAEQNLINYCSSHRVDGGREGNRYAVTRLGRKVLAITDESWRESRRSVSSRSACDGAALKADELNMKSKSEAAS